MSVHAITTLVGVLAVAGGIGAASGVHYLRKYVVLTRSDPTDIVDVEGHEETVELVGRARPADDPLTSPFLGEDTLADSWRLKQNKLIDGGSGTHWIESCEQTTPFVLEDSTGEILVDPEGADLALEEEVVLKTDDETPPPPAAREKLAELGRDAAAESPDEFLWREFYASRLDPGEEVHVYGPVRPGPAEDTPDIGTGRGQTDGRFIISDTGEQETKRRHLLAAVRWGGAGVGLLAVALVMFLVL